MDVDLQGFKVDDSRLIENPSVELGAVESPVKVASRLTECPHQEGTPLDYSCVDGSSSNFAGSDPKFLFFGLLQHHRRSRRTFKQRIRKSVKHNANRVSRVQQ